MYRLFNFFFLRERHWPLDSNDIKYRLSFLLVMLIFANRICYSQKNIIYSGAITFNAISLPFQQLSSHFSSVGGEFGVSLPWNSKGNLRQSIEVGFISQRHIFRGPYVHTLFQYNPQIIRQWKGIVQVGPGIAYLIPGDAGYSIDNGTWRPKTSGKLIPHLQLAIGIQMPAIKTKIGYFAPLVQYNAAAWFKVNPTLPLVPGSCISIGTKFRQTL